MSVKSGSDAELAEEELLVQRLIELEIRASGEKLSTDSSKEDEKEATTKKVEEGSIPISRKKGKMLSYVAPCVKQGIPTAKLESVEIEREAEKWKNAIK